LVGGWLLDWVIRFVCGQETKIKIVEPQMDANRQTASLIRLCFLPICVHPRPSAANQTLRAPRPIQDGSRPGFKI
jgi:hypothetical protein